MKRFTRLALGFSKKKENLIAAVGMQVAYHNFCRIHATPRCTPAMAASLTGKLWSLTDLFNEVERLVWQRKRTSRINLMLERMRSVTK
jgi:hypothetical protein